MNGISKRTALVLAVLSLGGSSLAIAPTVAFGDASSGEAGLEAGDHAARGAEAISKDGMTFRVVAAASDGTLAGVVLESGAAAVGDVEVPSIVEGPDGTRYEVLEVAPRAFMGNLGLKSIVFHDGPVSIGASAFRGCSSLERVELPRTLKVLGVDGNGNASTFVGCASMLAIEVPGSLAVIPPDAFRQCSGLESVVLEEGVEEIGVRAFDLAVVGVGATPGISLVSIPATVKRIGVKFLSGASETTVLRFAGEVPPEFAEGAFNGIASGAIPRVEYPIDAVREFAGPDSKLVREGIIEQAWFGDAGPSASDEPDAPEAVESDEVSLPVQDALPASEADRGSSDDVSGRGFEGMLPDDGVAPSSDSTGSRPAASRRVVSDRASVRRAPEHLCPSAAFSDVGATAWYHRPMDWAIQNGFLRGYASGMMGPDDVVTRAMAVTVLSRVAGADYSARSGATRFLDVDPFAWYAPAVAWGAGERLVAGYGDGSAFGPNDALTREQLAVILMRFSAARGDDVSSRSDLSRFSDSQDVSFWARDAVEWSVANDYLLGFSDGEMLGATMPVTRAQLAAIMMRYCASA